MDYFKLPVFPWNIQKVIPEIEHIEKVINSKKGQKKVFPESHLVFRAFELCPKEKVRVVIFGQDPYPTEHKGKPIANGLAFSTPRELNCITTSLKNIYTELKNCYPELKIPDHGDLSSWCSEGVLLLNASLTVFKEEPRSHYNLWTGFIYKIISEICKSSQPIVFFLWGRDAQSLEDAIVGNHVIFRAVHPASRDGKFIGNKHFLLANDYFIKNGQKTISWEIQ